MARGFLITCEGIDGSGKSTAASGLVEALRKRGHDARARVEPTPTWLGEAVRRGFREDVSPWTEALLFMADHATNVRRVRAEVDAGAIVVSDRWSDSTFAYQGAALAAPGFDALTWLQEMEAPFDHEPDLTLLFDLDAGVAVERIARRGEGDAGLDDKFERLGFLEKVRENYLRLAGLAHARYVVLDASRPAGNVLQEVLDVVVARMSSAELS